MAATPRRGSRWLTLVATVVMVVGACGVDGSTEPAQTSATAEGTTVPDGGPASDVPLEALVTIADLPEGYAELDADSGLGASSLAAILDGSSCWSADIETKSEAVSRFFLDDGIHGRLVESGMALLPTDDGARFTDALATTVPCIEQSSDGVWQTKVASDTAPDAGIPVDAVLQFTVTKEQSGLKSRSRSASASCGRATWSAGSAHESTSSRRWPS